MERAEEISSLRRIRMVAGGEAVVDFFPDKGEYAAELLAGKGAIRSLDSAPKFFNEIWLERGEWRSRCCGLLRGWEGQNKIAGLGRGGIHAH
jgi:hypothetical protein